LAREYPEAAKEWAILSLSPEGISGEGKGVSLPTRDGKSLEKQLAKSTLLFTTFSLEEKVVKRRSDR
jgi:hypothetical protein